MTRWRVWHQSEARAAGEVRLTLALADAPLTEYEASLGGCSRAAGTGNSPNSTGAGPNAAAPLRKGKKNRSTLQALDAAEQAQQA